MITSNNITLRPEYQEPAHADTIAHCRMSIEPAFLDQSVGAGKTMQIAFFAKHVSDRGGKALALARQGELIDQNSSDAWLIGCKNSIYSSSLKEKSTFYPVVMGTTGTVVNALNTDFKEIKFNVILIDECHEVPFDDVLECIEVMKKGGDYLAPKEVKNEKPVFFSEYARIIAHVMKINPKVRVIGYSGSPIRNNNYILGAYWKKVLSSVSTDYLVGLGYLVPYIFGFSDDSYELSSYEPSANVNADDFSASVLKQQDKEIHKQKTKTQKIMEEVMDIAASRNGVLITCAGKKHCQDVAECLPEGSYSIVTDETSFADRMQALKDAKSGKKKYTIQVYCLGQGVNVPLWDTLVILRPIGSLRYLIQLIGRILRLLKDESIKAGFSKSDGLILDYSGTMEAMGKIFDNPIINDAVAKKAQRSNEYQECPIPSCGTKNSIYAIRCIGKSDRSPDGRCEHFFKSQLCMAVIKESNGRSQHCETENAPSSQTCRKCGGVLIDPNTRLLNKAYTEADFKGVKFAEYKKTKSGDGLAIHYHLESTHFVGGIETPEIAKDYYQPFSKEPHQRQKWSNFIKTHVASHRFQQSIFKAKSIKEIINSKAIFSVPLKITHRINDKGFSIINRRKFRDGRESE